MAMTGKRIIIYLLATFIAGNLLLIYIQYNSAKNINTLINSNQKVLAEITVSNNLRELKRDVTVAEGSISNPSGIKNHIELQRLKGEILKVQSDIDKLQKISDDDTSEKYIDMLDVLVHEKLNFSRDVYDSINILGNPSLKGPAALRREKELNDSIRIVTRKIELSRQKVLAKVTNSIDVSGKKALNLGTSLIVLVLTSGAGIFWLIITTIRKQNILINKLNISEKNAREAAKVKENFMANMSHEIRTPLNAILGFADLLKRKELDAEAGQFIHSIQKSGENLLSIINDILDLSKIEAGMMRIESAPFNIRGLIDSIVIMFAAKASEKQLQLDMKIDDSIPDMLVGDSVRLTQILVNLVGNAIKFTEKGSVAVKINKEWIEDESVKISIIVSDTGVGIEQDKMQHIFDRFHQAEDSVTRKYGGTGLGLSIVYDLVVLQNGTIDVESSPGEGTTFTVHIAYKIASNQQEVTPVTSTKPIQRAAFDNTRVLVVEDNSINQNFITHLFREWKLDLDLANNGSEAIGKLRSTQYDLVLMDIQMPVMDGYTAAKEIRNELKSNVPIVAMTAHAMAGEREKCLSYGMNDYISKPVREEELQRILARYGRKKIRRAASGERSSNAAVENNFHYIRIQYLNEISMGNKAFEKNITRQFIDTIPASLDEIKNAWKASDLSRVNHLAHDMKTSAGLLQLNELLQPYLDPLESENLDEDSFYNNFTTLEKICNSAVNEAQALLNSL
jgi:signal transduction histidine kinase/CheY-like chemotaxis protein/HPt (histidine-containing phosphotransfer) domain-containing protein